MPTWMNIDRVITNAGGYGKCTFTKRDARNYIYKEKRQKLRAVGGDDAVALTDYFDKNKLADPKFFYTYSFTDEGRLWNIFWMGVGERHRSISMMWWFWMQLI